MYNLRTVPWFLCVRVTMSYYDYQTGHQLDRVDSNRTARPSWQILIYKKQFCVISMVNKKSSGLRVELCQMWCKLLWIAQWQVCHCYYYQSVDLIGIGIDKIIFPLLWYKIMYNGQSFIADSSLIDGTVVKAFALQADGLGFISPSGCKVGRRAHSTYVWVGQNEPSCLKFPSSVLEDKL